MQADRIEKPATSGDYHFDENEPWTPAVPVEDDPFFTPERLVRLQQHIAKQDPRRSITLTSQQVHAIINIFEQ
ncbi:MAG: hypothetical protein LBN39_10140 [Planctomycetaceae bacterium]|jgi:hypothetical protein|nr:hypothetical protein [Planctomycetaceae bacterium]